jgi:hypothetical protein
VPPDLLDDVFLLHLALEATKGILQRLALLQSNFCQSDHLPANNQSRTLELTSFVLRSAPNPLPIICRTDVRSLRAGDRVALIGA